MSRRLVLLCCCAESRYSTTSYDTPSPHLSASPVGVLPTRLAGGMNATPPAVAAPLRAAMRGAAPLAGARAAPRLAAAPAALATQAQQPRGACVRRSAARSDPGGSRPAASRPAAPLLGAWPALRRLGAVPAPRAPARGARHIARAADEAGQKKVRRTSLGEHAALRHAHASLAPRSRAPRRSDAAWARRARRKRPKGRVSAAESPPRRRGAGGADARACCLPAPADQPARVHGEGLGGHRGGARNRARKPAAGAPRSQRTRACLAAAAPSWPHHQPRSGPHVCPAAREAAICVALHAARARSAALCLSTRAFPETPFLV